MTYIIQRNEDGRYDTFPVTRKRIERLEAQAEAARAMLVALKRTMATVGYPSHDGVFIDKELWDGNAAAIAVAKAAGL